MKRKDEDKKTYNLFEIGDWLEEKYNKGTLKGVS